jgi:hypothetical protein
MDHDPNAAGRHRGGCRVHGGRGMVWCEKVQAFGLTVAVQETRSPTFQDAIRSQSALRTASLALFRTVFR